MAARLLFYPIDNHSMYFFFWPRGTPHHVWSGSSRASLGVGAAEWNGAERKLLP